MKPTRNRYFCNEARRSKMLFESESQANNFIKFNAGEMEELGGKVPVRSYFCAFCNGWHVTSNPNAEFFENHPSKAEIVLESIIQERKKRDESKVERLLKKGEEMNEQGLFKDACGFYINCYHSLKSDSTKKEKAILFLKKAFAAECSLVSQILEEGQNNNPEICSKAKAGLKSLKKASYNCGEDFTEYIRKLSSICRNFPDAPEM